MWVFMYLFPEVLMSAIVNYWLGILFCFLWQRGFQNPNISGVARCSNKCNIQIVFITHDTLHDLTSCPFILLTIFSATITHKKAKIFSSRSGFFRWIYPHVSIAFKYIYLNVKITRHVITSLPMSANCMFLRGTWESRDWAGCLTVVLDLGLGILRYWSNFLFFLSKSSWRLWYFCPVGHYQILFLT